MLFATQMQRQIFNIENDKMQAPAVYLKPDFLSASDQLFKKIKNEVTWDERMRARKTASFGVAYDYSQILYAPTTMPDFLQTICQSVENELGFLPNNCLMNFYTDGNSSIGFHSDSIENLAEGSGVVIISLGSLHHIAYRSKKDKSQEFVYPLSPGSLLYMSNAIQEDWLHAIPKEAAVGERISLTFRKITVKSL
ncbi:alpha-ketoglutarate-dependent dioxygenase AlkB [Undibacterium sp. JH2W]|uniref:alpha-ketoglutarate-dependent dioxygenase AlkB n=1 Tax=Undibacterium sp. JH2W TaxID=3413037 RepID=UPI003BF40039